MSDQDVRDGERALPAGALDAAPGARVVFIGRIRSPWTDRAAAPRNLRQARERAAGEVEGAGAGATVEVDPPFRAGLADLGGLSHAILLYWLDRARRDLIVQVPRHAGAPRGVFSLRSPVRPNPIGLGVVRILGCDAAAGILRVDAIDCLDGTPLLDIKPYLPSVDADPGAIVP